MKQEEFVYLMNFIRKLENMETHGQGCGYDFGYLYRDEFELLKKYIRLAYYHNGD